jgi:hypothetical protein
MIPNLINKIKVALNIYDIDRDNGDRDDIDRDDIDRDSDNSVSK